MKKKFTLLAITFILFLTMSPTLLSAETRMVTSDGFITSYSSSNKVCNSENFDSAKTIFNVNSEGGSKKAEDDEEDPGFVEEAMSGFVAGGLAWLVETASSSLCPDSGDTDSLGLFSQIYMFSEPVNVTNIKNLMAVTGMVQWLALTLMIFGIAYFGYQVTLGNKEVDPFKFAFRFIGSAILVYYAPYFVQDILGINNKIVNSFGSFGLELATGVNATVVTILPMSFVGFISSVGDVAAEAPGSALMMLIVLLIIVILCLVPMLKLVVWWYVRLFKLFLYTAISPIMFATFALDDTSNTGSNFLRSLVKEVFSQFFVVLGLYVTGAFISQLPTLAASTNMGIIGMGIALYAALSFLNEIPSFAGELIEGNVSSRAGRSVAGGVARFNNTIGGKVRGAVGSTAGNISRKMVNKANHSGSSTKMALANSIHKAGKKTFSNTGRGNFNKR